MGRNDYTGLLYAQPSFVDGLARVLDVGGTFDDYNTSATEAESDGLALASDWYAVGADLYHAILRYPARAKDDASHGKPARASRRDAI